MSKILEKIQLWYKESKPFVAYRKPNSNSIAAFFQKNDTVTYSTTFSESGFIFAPFDDASPAILIPQKTSTFLEELVDFDIEISEKTVVRNENIEVQNFHQNIVAKAVEKIKNNEFKKVVLSRKEEITIPEFNLIDTFKKLIVSYPTAMVYVWFHPKVGLWIGATPETLVKINGADFETMSLAGTQIFNGKTDVNWQPKELEEQQLVTDYILENISPVCEQVAAGKVETVKAGNLLHLRTKISGKLTTETAKLITKLHPTPAVCGLPKEKTKTFILETENYNRAFYTGFLGELNIESLETNNERPKTKDGKLNSELFVNLRCMQIKNNKASIYIGGGITKDSNPLKEWQETVAKTKTMKKVL